MTWNIYKRGHKKPLMEIVASSWEELAGNIPEKYQGKDYFVQGALS